MRICLIGPSYPFRGGISHYTTLLYRHLKKRHDVTFFAFKTQYPSWLFPGKSDRDASNTFIKEDDVENILESLNPVTWWRVASRIRCEDPELLIVPWWVPFWTPQFWTIVRLTKRYTNAKVLFICHNVVAHEEGRLDRVCNKMVLNRGDYFIVHSQEDMDNLYCLLPNARAVKTYHPTYDVFNMGVMSKRSVREQLGIRGDTILFFGFVRPYKGLDYLIEAMPLVRERKDIHLLVVGEFWEGKQQYLERLEELDLQEHVTIIDRYVPNEEVGVYFSASDLVVLPYVSATGSGIIQVAFGFHKPVVTTAVGCLPEVVQDDRMGFVVPPRSSDELAKAILRFYCGHKESEFTANIVRENRRFSWDVMVEQIENLQGTNGSFT